MNTFFTGDTHWGHANILRYCRRPWLREGDLDKDGKWVSDKVAKERADEMDEDMINKWNSKVGLKDYVYHVGDIFFGKYYKDKFAYWHSIRSRLNGKILLIIGNHDANIGSPRPYGLEGKTMMHIMKIDGHKITLCHYAMRVWDDSHFDEIHLYGHSHGMAPPIGKSWDVGVDVNNFAPLAWDEIVEIMKNRPHNENWIHRLAGFSQEEFDKYRALRQKDQFPFPTSCRVCQEEFGVCSGGIKRKSDQCFEKLLATL